MAPAQRGTVGAAVATANNVATPTTLTPVLPAHQIGDLLLAYTACRATAPTVATPAGWTQLLNVTGTVMRIALFGKVAASASETNPGIVWSGLTTGTGGTPAQAQAAVFQGTLDTITGITDVLGTVENGAGSTTASASGTAITTVGADDLVVSLSARPDDVGAWAPPAGFTEIGEALTTSGADMAFSWAYQVKATPGSVAPADFGLSGGAVSQASAGIMIALKARVPVTLFGVVARPITFGKAVAGQVGVKQYGAVALPITFGKEVAGDVVPTATTHYGATSLAVTFDKQVQGVRTVFGVVGTPGAAPGFTDNFNRASLGATWTQGIYAGEQLTIQSNDRLTNVSGWGSAFYNPATYGPDTQMEFTFSAAGTLEAAWKVTNAATPSPNGYFIHFEYSGTANIQLWKMTLGTQDSIGATQAVDWAAGDSFKIEQIGSIINVYKKPLGSGEWTLVMTRTDASYTSVVGNFGFLINGAAIDNLIAGDYGAAAGGTIFTFGATTSGIQSSGSITHYGIVALPITVGKAVVGQRKTFGQVARPITFTKAVAGRKQTFGVVALPVTFTKAVAGQRRTTGSVALAVTFTKVVAAQRKTFGVVDRPIVFSKTTTAQRKTFGQVTAPFTFTKDVKGSIQGEFTPDTLTGLTVWVDASQLGLADGAAVDPWPNLGSGGDGVIVGTPAPKVRANALNDLPVVRFTVNEGRVRGIGMCVDGSFDLTLLYVGRMVGPNVGRIFSNNYPPYNFLVGTHTAGEPRMYDNGWIDQGAGWTGGLPTPWKMYEAVCSETPRNSAFYVDGVFIQEAGTSAGHTTQWNLSGYETAAGETCDCEVAEMVIYDRTLTPAERQQVEQYLTEKWIAPPAVTHYGSTSLALTATITTAATRRTTGVVARPITFAKAVAGQRKTFGQVARLITFTKQVQAQKKTFGQVALPVTFTKSVAARRTAFGQVALPVTFTKSTAAHRTAFGKIVMPITSTFVVTILNTATRSIVAQYDIRMLNRKDLLSIYDLRIPGTAIVGSSLLLSYDIVTTEPVVIDMAKGRGIVFRVKSGNRKSKEVITNRRP